MPLSRLALVIVFPTWLVGSPLAAQQATTGARAAAVAEMRRELANAAAAERSGHTRTKTFGRATGTFMPDTLVRFWRVESDTTAWSAIAIHRLDTGVRCAVILGTAQTLLNGVRSGDPPGCVDEDGIPIAADPVRDPSWLFWSTDPVLEIGPRQLECPPLAIPKRPETNDSIYAEFVVGVDGRVESAPLAIESTGSLDATIGMLMRLSRCEFEPARLDGAPVRALLRQRIGLAPDKVLAPAVPERDPDTTMVDLRPGNEEAMRAALGHVAAAQAQHHAGTGAFAARVPAPADSPGSDSGIHLTMVSWSASGWSAMATHDSSTTRCFAGAGDGVPIPADGWSAPFCLGPDGQRPPPDTPPGPVVVTTPPERQRCDTGFQFRDDPRRRVRVLLEFVVGRDGRPEPGTVRVPSSSGLVDAAGAVQVIAGCRYRPGKVGRDAVRVMVRQPVYFN
jgi:hypothetical protein